MTEERGAGGSRAPDNTPPLTGAASAAGGGPGTPSDARPPASAPGRPFVPGVNVSGTLPTSAQNAATVPNPSTTRLSGGPTPTTASLSPSRPSPPTTPPQGTSRPPPASGSVSGMSLFDRVNAMRESASKSQSVERPLSSEKTQIHGPRDSDRTITTSGPPRFTSSSATTSSGPPRFTSGSSPRPSATTQSIAASASAAARAAAKPPPPAAATVPTVPPATVPPAAAPAADKESPSPQKIGASSELADALAEAIGERRANPAPAPVMPAAAPAPKRAAPPREPFKSSAPLPTGRRSTDAPLQTKIITTETSAASKWGTRLLIAAGVGYVLWLAFPDLKSTMPQGRSSPAATETAHVKGAAPPSTTDTAPMPGGGAGRPGGGSAFQDGTGKIPDTHPFAKMNSNSKLATPSPGASRSVGSVVDRRGQDAVPMEVLYYALRHMADSGVALTPGQAHTILPLMKEALQLEMTSTKVDQAYVSGVYNALNTQQRAFLVANHGPVSANTNLPLDEYLLNLLASRAGVDVHTIKPWVGQPGHAMMAPDDITAGLVRLDGSVNSLITADQAKTMLPIVKAYVDVQAQYSTVKRRVLAELGAEQTSFVDLVWMDGRYRQSGQQVTAFEVIGGLMK